MIDRIFNILESDDKIYMTTILFGWINLHISLFGGLKLIDNNSRYESSETLIVYLNYL